MEKRIKPPPPVRKKGPVNKAWKIPKIWDSTCFILGGGPSLSSVDLDLIKKYRVIAVNNAYGTPVSKDRNFCYYDPHDWVDVCWFGDERWYHWHKRSLRKFKGLIVCCRENMHGSGVYGVCRGKPEGIEARPRFVSWNRSSGASAINLAYHLGARKIVLLGFDMRRVDDKPNWHDDHPSPAKNPYTRFLQPFPKIAADAKELGLEIINATPGSAIKQFPIMPLKEVLTNEKI